MFAGMIKVQSGSACHRCSATTGVENGAVSVRSRQRRSLRRPGHMRAEPLHTRSDFIAQNSVSHLWNAEIPGNSASELHNDSRSSGIANSGSSFSSSFSFIQRSLDTATLSQSEASSWSSVQSEEAFTSQRRDGDLCPGQWRNVPDSDSLESSDSTSASSVTSGYDSTSPASETLQKSQIFLQHNHCTEIAGASVKPQLDAAPLICFDAESSIKRLGLLQKERDLQARQPEDRVLLQRLRKALHSATCRTHTEHRQAAARHAHRLTSRARAERIQLKLKIQEEMCALQRRLEELQEQSRALEEEEVSESEKQLFGLNQVNLSAVSEQREKTMKCVELQEDSPHSFSESWDLASFSGSGPSGQTLAEDDVDCAMLTALRGRWCPEAELQHSLFAKKLQEFLFSDSSSEDVCVEVTERCGVIRERLRHLEDQLELQDESSLCLEKEVEEVKRILQNMMSQLQHQDGEEDQTFGRVDEEEHQYFSDSWGI